MVLALCASSTLAGATAQAADVPLVIAAEQRTVAGGRTVQIILPQTRIETTFDVGRVASSANGGGLLGASIISSMDDKREKLSQSAHERAEARIAPLRQALQGFDIDALVMSTTKSAVAKPAWFQPASFAITNDPGIETRTDFLASLKSPQYVVIAYRYETSPDFTQIRVLAEIRLGRAGTMKRGAPALTILYGQRIVSIVQLRNPSFEPSENVARWTADDSQLAKAALTSAFARLEGLIPFALDLSDTQVKAITAKGREKAFAAGFYGPRVERYPAVTGETLIWKDGLVNVQSAGD